MIFIVINNILQFTLFRIEGCGSLRMAFLTQFLFVCCYVILSTGTSLSIFWWVSTLLVQFKAIFMTKSYIIPHALRVLCFTEIVVLSQLFFCCVAKWVQGESVTFVLAQPVLCCPGRSVVGMFCIGSYRWVVKRLFIVIFMCSPVQPSAARLPCLTSVGRYSQHLVCIRLSLASLLLGPCQAFSQIRLKILIVLNYKNFFS